MLTKTTFLIVLYLLFAKALIGQTQHNIDTLILNFYSAGKLNLSELIQSFGVEYYQYKKIIKNDFRSKYSRYSINVEFYSIENSLLDVQIPEKWNSENITVDYLDYFIRNWFILSSLKIHRITIPLNKVNNLKTKPLTLLFFQIGSEKFVIIQNQMP